MSAAGDRLGFRLSWIRAQPRSKTRIAAALIWVAFIVFPLIDALGRRGATADRVFAVVGAAVFVAGYVWLVLLSFGRQRRGLAYSLTAMLVLAATALTLFNRPGWAYLFIYCAACVVMVIPQVLTFGGLVTCTALAVVCSAAGGSAATALSAGASTIGVGLLMVLMRDLRARNEELCAARAELARVAVAEERERFARDLHDLLGHSLSVIALKAELAGKLIGERPEQAAVEVGEVEAVARQALGEVREAVSGYRQPTLEGELAGARMALSAAGIEAHVQLDGVGFSPSSARSAPVGIALRPDVEAVLAWAVREGATNVIRHSGARHCTLRISAGPSEAAVEVIDDGDGGREDGRSGRDASANGGHGLPGLRERAAALSGHVEAGRVEVGPARTDGAGDAGGPDAGGFRLRVAVPRPEARA